MKEKKKNSVEMKAEAEQIKGKSRIVDVKSKKRKFCYTHVSLFRTIGR
jgi:hypothetical protein